LAVIGLHVHLLMFMIHISSRSIYLQGILPVDLPKNSHINCVTVELEVSTLPLDMIISCSVHLLPTHPILMWDWCMENINFTLHHLGSSDNL